MTRRSVWAAGVAAIAVLAAAAPAGAFPLDLGDDWEATWTTTVSAEASWRTADPSNKLYTAADGARLGLKGGLGGAPVDSGDLNYKSGDLVSNTYKLLTELGVRQDDLGGFIRVKAWYDRAEANEAAHYGNEANGYAADSRLSDKGFENLQRFRSGELLDAYLYDTVEIAGNPTQFRLGHQVINWGESLFVQGINQINPLDIPSLRRPGSEIKEGLLPVWAAYANMGLGGGASLEAFYQFKWEPTTVDACGTYWSVVDTNIGTKAGACNKIMFGSASSPMGAAMGTYAPLTDGRDARNSGEFGAAIKLPVEAIDTEFGLYAMNLNSRLPIISTRTGGWGGVPAQMRPAFLFPFAAIQGALAPLGVRSSSAFWEYPNDIQYYGVSAATNIGGWSLGAEFSYTPNLPVQRNGNDMILGILQGVGPLGGIYRAAGPNAEISGYDRFGKSQFQLNAVQIFNGVAGASTATLLGETAFEWVGVPDFRSGTKIRYGRAFIFGNASSAGLDTCALGIDPQPDGCRNDGFITNFSWGYRLSGSLEYPQIFSSAITFIPTLSVAHDVSGVSADNQFNGGRLQLGLNSRFSMSKRYNLDLGYVYYGKWAKYDPLRDHDYFSAAFSVTF